MSRNRIKMGDTYRDEITGFEGIITARFEYMNGCVRYELEAADAEGRPKGYVFDEQRLVKATTGAKPKPTATAGGSRTAPTR